MNESDRLLIASYAEGSLDGAEAERAAALVASDPAAREEHEAQTAALRALRTAAPAQMTTAERAGLRRAVAEAIGLAEDEAADHATTPSPSRRFRLVWGGLAAAAALVLVVVAAAPLLDTLSVGGDDETSATLELSDAAATSTTVAAGSAEPGPTRAEEGTAAVPPGDGDAFDAAEAPAATTTAAAETTSTAPAAAFLYAWQDEFLGLPHLGEGSADEILDRARLVNAAGEPETRREFFPDEAAACDPVIAAAVPGAGTITPVATATVDGIPAGVFAVTAADGGETLIGVAPDTCAVVAGPAAS